MQTPELSVLTPTYNGMPYLPRAISSTEQLVRAGVVEHVVADGGSQDGSLEYLEQTSAVWKSQPDRGQSDALNTALSMATAPWIGWLNCDEYYLSGVLPRVLDMIKTDQFDLIYGDFVEVTPDDQIIRLVTQHDLNPTVLDYFGLSLPSCTTFIRRDLVVDAGGWNPDNRTMMDWELWLKLQRNNARFHYTGRAHAGFTRHDMQASARLSDLVATENAALNEQFGITSSPTRKIRARGLRVGLKLRNGSYRREHSFAAQLRRRADLRDAACIRDSGGADGTGPVSELAPFILG